MSRLWAHAVLLAIAIGLTGVSFANPRTSKPRFTPTTADASTVLGGAGSDSTSISMGRQGTIIKPIQLPTAPVLAHGALHYTVVAGDTVARIADREGIPEEAVRWSNLGQLSRESSEPSAGSILLLPPVAGIALVSVQGDTIAALAERYHVDDMAIIDFNRVRVASEAPLAPGLELIVPGGRGPELAPAAPRSRAPASFRSSGSTVLGSGPRVPVAAGNHFAFGNCTFYVYNRRQVPWSGDAWAWYGNAQALGFATGPSPRLHAIMVTWESGYGHVAYVETVNGDGSWIVSEMNYIGFNSVDRRLIRPGGVPLIGFIY